MRFLATVVLVACGPGIPKYRYAPPPRLAPIGPQVPADAVRIETKALPWWTIEGESEAFVLGLPGVDVPTKGKRVGPLRSEYIWLDDQFETLRCAWKAGDAPCAMSKLEARRKARRWLQAAFQDLRGRAGLAGADLVGDVVCYAERDRHGPRLWCEGEVRATGEPIARVEKPTRASPAPSEVHIEKPMSAPPAPSEDVHVVPEPTDSRVDAAPRVATEPTDSRVDKPDPRAATAPRVVAEPSDSRVDHPESTYVLDPTIVPPPASAFDPTGTSAPRHDTPDPSTPTADEPPPTESRLVLHADGSVGMLGRTMVVGSSFGLRYRPIELGLAMLDMSRDGTERNLFAIGGTLLGRLRVGDSRADAIAGVSAYAFASNGATNPDFDSLFAAFVGVGYQPSWTIMNMAQPFVQLRAGPTRRTGGELAPVVDLHVGLATPERRR